MIAVCLLTCGRTELTERTVSSFADHNFGKYRMDERRRDLILLHANCGGDVDTNSFDGAEYNSNVAAAELCGFRTVHEPKERAPQMVSYRALIEEAALKGAEFVLWLENDWESVAPLPTLDFLRETAAEGIVTWRLFGVRRMRSKTERGLVRETQIGTDTPINWQPSGYKRWEFGRAHWGGGGCIATLAHLESQIHRPRLKDVVTAKPDLPTLRSIDNLVWHIGSERTPGLH